jgi:hypothetical protein
MEKATKLMLSVKAPHIHPRKNNSPSAYINPMRLPKAIYSKNELRFNPMFFLHFSHFFILLNKKKELPRLKNDVAFFWQ